MSILKCLQKMLVLADALQGVVFSDDLGRAIDSIRRNAMCSVRSKGAVVVARDLMSFRHALEESAKKILLESYHELERTNLSYASVNEQITEETLEKVKSYILSETKEYCLEVKKNLVINHVLFDEECKRSMPNYEEIARDDQAREALEAVSLYIATLNVTGSLVEQIKDVHDEINKLKPFGFENQQLLLHAGYVMHARDKSFECLARLWKTSRYAFNPKAIMFSKDYYKDFSLPDELYCDDEFKSDSKLGILPSSITFREKDGTLRELVS